LAAGNNNVCEERGLGSPCDNDRSCDCPAGTDDTDCQFLRQALDPSVVLCRTVGGNGRRLQQAAAAPSGAAIGVVEGSATAAREENCVFNECTALAPNFAFGDAAGAPGEPGGSDRGFMIDGAGFAGLVFIQFDRVSLQAAVTTKVMVDVWLQGDWALDTTLRAWVALNQGE